MTGLSMRWLGVIDRIGLSTGAWLPRSSVGASPEYATGDLFVAITDGPPLLEPHIVLDRHHALDAARDADGLVNVFLGIDKAA